MRGHFSKPGLGEGVVGQIQGAEFSRGRAFEEDAKSAIVDVIEA